MSELISAENVASLSANASRALGLVARGIRTTSVIDSLNAGMRLCEVVRTGKSSLEGTHEEFSASELSASQLVTLLVGNPDGQSIADDLNVIQTALRDVIEGQPPHAVSLQQLREYFYRLALSFARFEEVGRRAGT